MKFKKIISVIITLICVFVFFACGEIPIPKPKENIIDLAKYGVVEISVGKAQGSGVILSVDERTIIATNYHVIGQTTTASVYFYGENESRVAQVIGRDEYYDVCILECDYVPEKNRVFEVFSGYGMNDGVLSLGYSGGSLGIYDGIISTSEKLVRTEYGSNLYVIQTTTPYLNGCSGGALIDSEGRLLGLNAYGLRNGNIDTGLNYVIPAEVVEAIYKRVMDVKNSGATQIVSPARVFNINIDGIITVTLPSSQPLKLELFRNGAIMAGGRKLSKVNDYAANGKIVPIIAQMYLTHENVEFIF